MPCWKLAFSDMWFFHPLAVETQSALGLGPSINTHGASGFLKRSALSGEHGHRRGTPPRSHDDCQKDLAAHCDNPSFVATRLALMGDGSDAASGWLPDFD